MIDFKVYLSGEIHSDWRSKIIDSCGMKGLTVEFLNPVTTHEASDNVGVNILGPEEKSFWKDHKAALINNVRIRKGMNSADIVVVKFGEKYRQWNAAFDAGHASALGIPYIVIHPEEFTHALKEVDSQAFAVVDNEEQVVEILQYLSTQR